MESTNKPGAHFDIKQGSLQRALATRENIEKTTLKAPRWKSTRLQHKCYHHGKEGFAFSTISRARQQCSQAFQGFWGQVSSMARILLDLETYLADPDDDIELLIIWVTLLQQEITTLTK